MGIVFLRGEQSAAEPVDVLAVIEPQAVAPPVRVPLIGGGIVIEGERERAVLEAVRDSIGFEVVVPKALVITIQLSLL